jgi:hypothetical protein
MMLLFALLPVLAREDAPIGDCVCQIEIINLKSI